MTINQHDLTLLSLVNTILETSMAVTFKCVCVDWRLRIDIFCIINNLADEYGFSLTAKCLPGQANCII